jgi:hypothetical protein
MSRIAYILICLTGVAAGYEEQAQPPAGLPARIASRRYGFSIETPEGWRAARTPEGLPLYINFPWAELQARTGQNVLPKGGAMIDFQSEEGLPEPNGSYSLDDWADFDERGVPPEMITTRSFEMPTSTGVDKAVAVSFDEPKYSPDAQRKHSCTVYWQLHNKRFATRLSYVVGDPKGKDYEKALEILMRSIRPGTDPGGRKLP